MEREHRRVRRHLGWLIAGAVGVTMLVAAPAALAVVDTTEPVAPTTTVPAPPPTATTTSPVATTDPSAASEPIGTEPPAASAPADTTGTVDTTEPAASTEPVASEPASSAPTDTSATVATSEPPASSVEPDCTPLVDGDGPVTVPAGCALPAPSVAANPSLSPTCGVTVTIVVDRSASVDAGAVRSALTALVDALSGTGATVSLVDFSDSAAQRIAATELDDSTRGAFDGYIGGFSTGGSSNLGAGLATASAGSADLTLVVTDGVANASSTTPDLALTFAADQANALKGAGSHVFALGVGAADAAGLAAISGGAAGTDVGTADYSVGDTGAVADSLNALATDDCAVVAAADVGCSPSIPTSPTPRRSRSRRPARPTRSARRLPTPRPSRSAG